MGILREHIGKKFSDVRGLMTLPVTITEIENIHNTMKRNCIFAEVFVIGRIGDKNYSIIGKLNYKGIIERYADLL